MLTQSGFVVLMFPLEGLKDKEEKTMEKVTDSSGRDKGCRRMSRFAGTWAISVANTNLAGNFSESTCFLRSVIQASFIFVFKNILFTTCFYINNIVDQLLFMDLHSVQSLAAVRDGERALYLPSLWSQELPVVAGSTWVSQSDGRESEFCFGHLLIVWPWLNYLTV